MLLSRRVCSNATPDEAHCGSPNLLVVNSLPVNYLDLDETHLAARTRAHYEAIPFVQGGPPRVALWRRKLRRLLSSESLVGVAVDVGCGSGEVAKAISDLGASVVGVDLTAAATSEATRLGVPSAQADALNLPIRARGVDLAVAIGSLHHTPDCERAFRQMADATRQTMVVLLYRRWTPYHLSYVVSAPVRRRTTAESVRRAPTWLLWVLRALIQPQVRTPLDDEQLQRVVADQFLTPRASFHRPAEVRAWATSAGFHVRRVRRSPLYSFTMVLDRTDSRGSSARTAAHYERFPFIEGGASRKSHWLRRLAPHLPHTVEGTRILDAGCGSGDLASALEDRGALVTAIDLTAAAVERTSSRLQRGSVAQASVLSLPFRRDTFDHALSIGVLHHTAGPREGLRELRRVTSGRIVVMVYARWTPYQLAYRLGRPLRSMDVSQLDQIPDWILRPSAWLIRLQRGQNVAPQQVRALIADQFWTPVASFHSMRELRRWAGELGLEIVSHTHLLWHANIVTFQARGLPHIG
jgi:ubiquinone/menaquinone biosynthesis C-methylase UbiE